MRVIFMGTPTPVIPVLEALCRMPEVEVAAAVTPPDRQRGRGRRSEPPPVKEAALRLGIPVLQPDSLRSQSARNQLAKLDPDVIVVAAYGKLLPRQVLELPPHGCLNLHPSLLPRHRGPSPVATAILEGDETTGLSLMLLDEGMDTGPVIARQQYTMTGQETAGDLTFTLFDMGAELLSDSLVPWVKGGLQAHPQDSALATVSRKLERTDGAADWTLSAGELHRQCRAYSPWPGLYTQWEGRTLKMLEVSPLLNSVGPELVEGRPGQVLSVIPAAAVAVATGHGLLGLSRLQLEGRRPVTIREFLAGHSDFVGAHLGN